MLTSMSVMLGIDREGEEEEEDGGEPTHLVDRSPTAPATESPIHKHTVTSRVEEHQAHARRARNEREEGQEFTIEELAK